MDYYGVLKVPANAKQVEIDRAYQKLVRDAKYDNTVNRKEIETAYKLLSDATQRALYDATQAEKQKAQHAAAKTQRKAMSPGQKQRYMLIVLVVLAIIAGIYYPLRFGYRFKTFETGDVVFYKDTDQQFGKIKKVEPNHSFGIASKDGYLIQTTENLEVWFPATDIKTLCYKK